MTDYFTETNSLLIPNDVLFSDNVENSVLKSNKSSSILQRVAASENAAISECVNFYGDFIWNLAKKYTRKEKETEQIVREIFLDIWTTAENFNSEESDERSFIALIALRRLLKK